MEDDFLIVGITLPAPAVENEARRIVELLERGAVDRMHLRKPNADDSVLERLLGAIPREYHCRLSLHDAPELIEKYPEVGFHFNGRHPSGVKAPVLSRSCHSVDDIMASEPGLDYVTLSPVYDSISKPGYAGQPFNLTQSVQSFRRVVALGGVTPSRFPELKGMGFRGAAMLGYLWDFNVGAEDIAKEIARNRI